MSNTLNMFDIISVQQYVKSSTILIFKQGMWVFVNFSCSLIL